MKNLFQHLYQLFIIIFILGSCTPDPVDECTEYLETVDGKKYFGSLRVCEEDMPQIEVSYPGYADVTFEGTTAFVRTNYEYISTDTITTIYNYRFVQIETAPCHIILEDQETGEIKGGFTRTLIHLIINPALNCGESDDFTGNYL